MSDRDVQEAIAKIRRTDAVLPTVLKLLAYVPKDERRKVIDEIARLGRIEGAFLCEIETIYVDYVEQRDGRQHGRLTVGLQDVEGARTNKLTIRFSNAAMDHAPEDIKGFVDAAWGGDYSAEGAVFNPAEGHGPERLIGKRLYLRESLRGPFVRKDWAHYNFISVDGLWPQPGLNYAGTVTGRMMSGSRTGRSPGDYARLLGQPTGLGTPANLSPEERERLRRLWAETYPEYQAMLDLMRDRGLTIDQSAMERLQRRSDQDMADALAYAASADRERAREPIIGPCQGPGCANGITTQQAVDQINRCDRCWQDYLRSVPG